MTIDPRLLAFIGFAAVLTILPGSDMALVTRNVLAVGRRRTMMTIIGILLGCAIHATASALGISAVLATSAVAFNVLKTAGAAYLVWLGIRAIQGAGKPVPPASAKDRGTSPFLQGFLTNILNPKVAIFYLTVLPQFVAPGDHVLRRSLLLASIHIMMGLVWLTAYAWFVDRLGGVLTRPRVKARLERVTGGLLIALGARLAWEHR